MMMVRGLGISAILLIYLRLCAVSCSADEASVACMMAYDKGGARAVLQSSECYHWHPSTENNRQNCQFAMLQGRREYQEDRVTCNLDMKIPYLGGYGLKEATVGIAAVFDGHGGHEASELASEKFLDYFRLNVQFNSYKRTFTLNQENEGADHCKLALKRLDDILEEVLMRTFQDIDSEFSMEALYKGSVAGSTGTVILLLNGQLLIGYVGDSKALLCRERIQSHQDAEVTELYAEELTRDHHPDRDDEKARIEAAGGIVRVWGVPRVNGILAVSRAIGDVYLKRYGVIAVPEVIGWRNLTREDSYVVIASDGIFERLTPQQVCEIIQSMYVSEKQASKSLFSCLSSSSLADCIVNTAFRKGSTDNLSAIIIPLKLTSSPFSSQQDAEAIDRAEL